MPVLFSAWSFFFPLLSLDWGFPRWEWLSFHVPCAELICAALVARGDKVLREGPCPQRTRCKSSTWHNQHKLPCPQTDSERLPGASIALQSCSWLLPVPVSSDLIPCCSLCWMVVLFSVSHYKQLDSFMGLGEQDSGILRDAINPSHLCCSQTIPNHLEVVQLGAGSSQIYPGRWIWRRSWAGSVPSGNHREILSQLPHNLLQTAPLNDPFLACRAVTCGPWGWLSTWCCVGTPPFTPSTTAGPFPRTWGKRSWREASNSQRKSGARSQRWQKTSWESESVGETLCLC